MADIVNLRHFRKKQARAQKERNAAENRIRFGRTKGQKACEGIERERPETELSGKKLEGEKPE